ncbi:uncharacterized protein LOC131948171 [Physella acuta]|uniref:uncharacterized protein LOC131948171 n=1 Tax=Physella acuta TaxID=109671 RepID=UPI0027DAEE94|nr:uncharacterized protein LOC131948171 [Physella acuta]
MNRPAPFWHPEKKEEKKKSRPRKSNSLLAESLELARDLYDPWYKRFAPVYPDHEFYRPTKPYGSPLSRSSSWSSSESSAPTSPTSSTDLPFQSRIFKYNK